MNFVFCTIGCSSIVRAGTALRLAKSLVQQIGDTQARYLSVSRALSGTGSVVLLKSSLGVGVDFGQPLGIITIVDRGF
jgi:hypothetical protein